MSKASLKEYFFKFTFVIVFLLVLSALTLLFYPKWIYGNEPNPSTGIYKEEKNSLDVLLFGSCNMYTSFSPVLFYEDTGVTSYVRACPDQLMSTSYYYLEEALKRQSPKVVAVEALFLTNISGAKRELYNREAVDYMRPSLTKLKLIHALVEEDVSVMQALDPDSPGKLVSFAGYVFPLLRYHSRDDISKKDLTFFFENKANVHNKGTVPYYSYATMDELQFDTVWNGHEIREDAKKYLPKIKELCDKNGIELIVVKSPNKNRWDDELTAYVREYVESEGISFIDIDDGSFGKYEEYDYQQGNRLNVYGIKKFTRAFGRFLVDRYQLAPTPISEASALVWKEAVNRFYETANAKYMSLNDGDMARPKCEDGGIMIR